MADDELLDFDDELEEDNIDDMYLTFRVADESYAVGIAYVTEIVGVQNIVEVPDVPNFIRGVINLRGKVITVMDIRLRFKMPWRDYDDRTCIIVLEHEDVLTGLVVDRVSEVLEILAKNIDPPPSWQHEGKHAVVRGMGKHDEKVSIILNVGQLLYEQDIKIPNLGKEHQQAMEHE